MPKYNWTRVLYPNGGYGYVKTDNSDLAIEYKRDGTFKVYSQPNEKSHSFFTSFETKPRTIQRAPDDHEAHLALQRQVDEKVRQVTPTAGQLFDIATMGGLNNLSPTQWMRRAYDTGQLIQGYMPLNEYMNKLYFGNNGIVSDEYARKHPYRAMAANLAGDIATFGAASTLRKMPSWYRTMLAENQVVQNTVANNWRNVGKDALIVDMRKPENWMSHQWDKAYNTAIARGDMAEAQRLRDLHFETIGNPVRTQEGSMQLTHATKNKFNSFDLSKAGTGSGNTTNTEGVIHLSPYDDAALDVFKPKTIEERNAYNLMHLYANNPNPVEVPLETFIKSWNDKELFKVLRDTGDGIIARGKSPYKLYAERLAEYERKKDAGKLMPWTHKPESPKDFMEEAVVDGYTINNPANLKSANAVTYDDFGNRIPLSLRDDFTSNDIRGRVINTYNHPEQFIHPAEAVRLGKLYVRPNVLKGIVSEPLMDSKSDLRAAITPKDLINRKFFSVEEYGPEPIYTRETVPLKIKVKKGDITESHMNDGTPGSEVTDANKVANEWFNKADHGQSVSYETDHSLSTDSYPIALLKMNRWQLLGLGQFIQSESAPKWMRLNRLGNKSFKELQEAIARVNKLTGLNYKIEQRLSPIIGSNGLPTLHPITGLPLMAKGIYVRPVGFFKYKNGNKIRTKLIKH